MEDRIKYASQERIAAAWWFWVLSPGRTWVGPGRGMATAVIIPTASPSCTLTAHCGLGHSVDGVAASRTRYAAGGGCVCRAVQWCLGVAGGDDCITCVGS